MIRAADQGAVRGAWYLMALQAKGLAWFDLSAPGYRRSWAAMALSLPFVLYRVAVFNYLAPAKTMPIPLLSVAVFMVVNWMIGVGGLVMFGVLFRQQARLVAAITLLNWLGLIGNLLLAAVTSLAFAGMSLVAAEQLVWLFLLYYLVVQGFALSRVWALHPLTLAGIVIFLFIVDTMTGRLFFQLLHAGSPQT